MWLALGGLIAVVVLVSVLFPSSRAVDGPDSSSLSTTPTGTAALAALLDERGHRVRRLRARLEDDAPPGGATTFLLDPIRLSGEEAAALVAFVREGGRLVAAGRGVERLAAELQQGAPRPAADGPGELRVAAPAPETAGVRTVRSSGERGWESAGGGLPLLADGETPGAARFLAGRGALILLADAGPLQNRLLGEADNAALALGLAGRRGAEVAFVESVHGYEEATGLAAIPGRWGLAILGLALATLLFGLARGRRFGPPERGERALDPPRRTYVEALASSLLRTKDRATAVAPVRDAARARLASRAGLAGDAAPEAWRRAAEQLELSPEETRALLDEDTHDLLATGRALARLTPKKDP